MKRLAYLVGGVLLTVACQTQELVNAPVDSQVQVVQPQEVVNVPIKSPILPMVKVKPEVQVVVKGKDIKLEVKLPALSEFKTQALDLATASKIMAKITDSYGQVYLPNGAVGGKVDYPGNGLVSLTFDAVVPDQLLLLELQVDDGSDDIPQAELALAIKHTGVTDLTTSMNFQTTPTAKAMKALLGLDATKARSLSLAALVTKMEEITGQTGTAPNFTYTTHPTLVNTATLASALNEGTDPASLVAATYRMVGATVALNVTGLVGSDKLDVQVTDAASAIKTALGNGSGAGFSIEKATPGNGLKVKVGASAGNTTQYTFAVMPSDTVNLTNNATTHLTITASPAAVTTTSLSSSSGIIGSTININGSGFSTTAGNNIVRFAGAGGNIDVAAATVNGAGTQLTVAVPATALHGSQNVTVRLSGGPESSPALTYDVRPEFTFATAFGAIGSTVTLNGSGFHTTDVNNDVRFSGGNTQAMVQSVNATGTQMMIQVPAGVSGTQTVTVKVGNQTSVSRTFNIVPTLASVTSAQVVGGTVTLTGSGFSATAANNTVRFIAASTVTAAAATVNAEGTQLTVAVPVGLFGNQAISVQVASFNSLGGQSLAITPNITNLSSTSGSNGDTLTITGTGFNTTVAGSNTVRLGVNIVSATLNMGNLVVTVPANAAGVANATVQLGIQTSAASNFTILPTITGITGAPTSGGKPALIRGETITITGTNFDTTVANNKVMFGSLEVMPATVPSNTSMTVVVPAAAETETLGDVSVRVKTNNQTSSTSVTATVVGVTLSVTNGGLY